MRIVFIQDWFGERMGYADHFLPKALATLGHEVHVVTSNVQPYFNSPNYRETYEPFLGPAVVPCGVKQIDGYTLHRLPHALWRRRLRIQGLRDKLRALRPEIVQTFDADCPTTYEAALMKPLLRYHLFLACHIHASVFPVAHARTLPLRWRIRAATLGRWLSSQIEKCYPISTDAADIVIRFLGIPKEKVRISPLGVDTDLFRPPEDDGAQQSRSQLRRHLGFSEFDIVCVYSGRFSPEKDPLCLARAIGILLHQGLPFRGLFVGAGPQASAIQLSPGCVVHRFVPFRELPPLYWAADIAVWPRQESTSQLDAAACGLPLVLSRSVQVRERIDENGLLYDEGNPRDLAQQLATLVDPQRRRQMGNHGARKMRERFSWLDIARQRVRDYEAALAEDGNSQ
jgi:glycosyltransferase involved in cell wall biosynthesis